MRFSEIPYDRPPKSQLHEQATACINAWQQAGTADAQIAILNDWQQHSQHFHTLASLAEVRFQQNTADPGVRAEKEYFDEVYPEVQGNKIRFLKQVLASPHRPALEKHLGQHVFNLWQAELTTFRDEIADDKRAESALCMQYSSALAALRIPVDGTEYTLSTLPSLFDNPDRSIRQTAISSMAGALQGIQDELDDIYGQLVTVRSRMATTLGFSSYTPLGYQEMLRTDYTAAEVADFREAIKTMIVPLAQRIRGQQAQSLGVDLAYHDESLPDPKGAPRPQGGHDWMLEQASQMFAQMGSDFSTFFEMMRRRDLLDLQSRPGKAGGGFCTSFETQKVPFIFANFNGTLADVNVFTHECGHAFQVYTSRDLQPREYLWPTYEACEIHSMGLEFLSYPHMELFFGDDADRFRTGHLKSALTFLPYGAAVDAFQHRVYASPADRAAEWTASWSSLEADYLPWRRYVDAPYFSTGRFWQKQRHIYQRPFYYIDYCLAQVCALQLWSRARTDREGTMSLYRELCALGGQRPFTELLEAVGLDNPFNPDVIERVAREAAETLNL